MNTRATQIVSTLTSLLNTDPLAAVRAARVLEGDDLSTRCLRAAFLVDGGIAAGDAAAISEGRDMLRAIQAETGSPAIGYNLANALAGLSRLDGTPRPDWFEVTREVRLESRRLFVAAARNPDLDIRTRGAAWTNLGGELERSFRDGEACDAYRDALRLDPTNGVAAGKAALLLERLHRSGIGSDRLLEEVASLAQVAVHDKAEVFEHAGPDAFETFSALRDRHSNRKVAAQPRRPDSFATFLAEHRLSLAPTVERTERADGPDDYIHLGNVLEQRAGAGAYPPSIFAMFNVVKADYVLARDLAYRGIRDDQASAVPYTTTLDSALYGTGASSLVLAQRTALDVLDKIAVALNEHMSLGLAPHKVSFRNLWRDDRKTVSTRRPEVVEHLTRGCRSLVALSELADDLIGHRAHVHDVRNAATHRFVVLYQDSLFDTIPSAAIERFKLSEFERMTIEALQVARSAVQYMKRAIDEYESVFSASVAGPIGSIALPNIESGRPRE